MNLGNFYCFLSTSMLVGGFPRRSRARMQTRGRDTDRRDTVVERGPMNGSRFRISRSPRKLFIT